MAETGCHFGLGGFAARGVPDCTDESGHLSSLFDEDRSQWDSNLLDEGQRYLDLSATGLDLTEYHVEAAIAWVHATAISTEETDWKHIVSLYELLMTIRSSPVVELNRAIAIGQYEGPTTAKTTTFPVPPCRSRAT